MSERPPARLSILFARDAPRAVIFRKGPTRDTRLILWHTNKDTFEDGQWVRHKLHPLRSMLSPDGRNFAYAGLKWPLSGTTLAGGFLAISRPPWFTALWFYPQGDTWGTGLRFVDNRHVLLPFGVPRQDLPSLPAPLQGVYHPAAMTNDPFNPDGRATAERVDHFCLPDGTRAPISRRDIDGFYTEEDVLNAARYPAKARGRAVWHHDAHGLPLPDWCAVRDGCLYRRRETGEDVLIRDFNAMKFEAVTAPYA